MRDKLNRLFLLAAVIVLAAGTAQADVFNMGGTQNADGSWNGLASIEMVTVGNPGNAADTRYDATGYGSVDYSYQIGKYEVTSAQYVEFLNAVAKTDSYGLYNTSMGNSDGCKIERSGSSGSYTYSVASDRANRPVNYVSWGDGVRFANWLHNGQPTGVQDLTTTEDGAYYLNGATSQSALMAVTRETNAAWFIPTEDEWYKAAYHKNDGVTGNYYDYPTSSDSTPSNDLTDPDSGNNANFHDNGYTIDSPYYTTEVGEFENSESPYGTFDQGGNLWEWNETMVSSAYRGWRGGGWNYHSSRLQASFRTNNYPATEYASVGFRVASVPEPGSLAMLLGIALMGLLYRKHKND